MHSAQSLVHYQTASLIRDSTARRLEQLNKALESSRQALALSPNSNSFSLFHAILLSERARNDAGPAAVPIPASQVEKMRKELAELIEKSKIKILVLGGVNRRENWNRLLEDNALAEVKKEFEALQGKKKVVKKVVSKDRVRAYWNDTMSVESKRELLRIGIEELKAHLDKNELGMAKEVFTKAVDYAKESKKWKFWTCCCCGGRFCDVVSTAAHLRKHLGSSSERYPGLVPQRDHEWAVNMVETGVWKPLEVLSDYDWRYVDDDMRTILIGRIREMLRLLIRYQCLGSSLFYTLDDFIIESLQKHVPKPVFTDHGLDKTLQSVCFLDVPELKLVLDSLEDLASSSALLTLCETFTDGEDSDDQGFWAKSNLRERIVFSGNFSDLLFDERLLQGDIVEPDNGNAVVTSGTSAAEDCDANGDSFVDWLWMGSPTIREQLKEWEIVRVARTSEGMELFEILRREDRCYQALCERKPYYVLYWYRLEDVNCICGKENRKREQISGYHPQSYASLLLKRWEKFDSEGDSFGLDIIWSILKEAQADTEIKMAIQKQRDQTAREIFLLDGIILVISAGMRQTRLKLEAVSVYDYRFIIVPMLKSFMKVSIGFSGLFS
jgi:hypothetical protein